MKTVSHTSAERQWSFVPMMCSLPAGTGGSDLGEHRVPRAAALDFAYPR